MAINTKVGLSFNNQAKLELIKHSDSAGRLAVPCAAEGFFAKSVTCSPFAKLATCGSVEKDSVLLCSDCETTSNLVVEALIKYKKSGGTEPEINCPVSSLCRLMPAAALDDDNVTLTMPCDDLLSKASGNRWIILTAEDINNIGTDDSLSFEQLLEKITHSSPYALEMLVENKEKLYLLLGQLKSADGGYFRKNKINRMVAAASQHLLNSLCQTSLELPYKSVDSETKEEQATTLEALLTSLTLVAASETSPSPTGKLLNFEQGHKLRSTLAREQQELLDITNSKITRTDVADLASPFAAVTKSADWLVNLLNKISKSGADEIALLTHAALEKLMLLIFNKISKQECSAQDISLIVNVIKALKNNLSEEMLNYTVRLSQQSGTRIVLLKVALEELSELSSERVAEMKSLKPLLKIQNKGVSASIEQYRSEMHLTDFDLIKLNKFGFYDWYISAPVLLIEKLLLTPVDTLRRLSGRQAMTLSILLKKTVESTKAHIAKKRMAKDAAGRLKNNLSQQALNFQGDFFDRRIFTLYVDGTVDTYLSNLLASFEGIDATAYTLPTNHAAETDKDTGSAKDDGVTEVADSADDAEASEGESSANDLGGATKGAGTSNDVTGAARDETAANDLSGVTEDESTA